MMVPKIPPHGKRGKDGNTLIDIGKEKIRDDLSKAIGLKRKDLPKIIKKQKEA